MEAFIVLFVIIFGILPGLIWWYWQIKIKKEQQWIKEMIDAKKGDFYVKIAASGKGGVYHSPSCGKCKSLTYLPLSVAKNQGYVPCSICGGAPFFHLLAD